MEAPTIEVVKLNVTTDQEAFDKVVRHLATMPGRAATNHGCVYRVEETGNRCAIGALVDDDRIGNMTCGVNELVRFGHNIECSCLEGYEEGEDATCNHMIDQDGPFIGVDIGDVNEDLLVSLQQVHDMVDNWRDGRFTHERGLRIIAKNYELDTAVIDEVFSTSATT